MQAQPRTDQLTVPSAATDTVTFSLLGPFRAYLRGTRLSLGRRRERALLGLLLLEAGATVSTARLVDLLWDGEPPLSANAAIHTHVSRLRGLLDPQRDGRYGVRLHAVEHGYRVEVAPDAVDVNVFTARVATARATPDPADRATVLRSALRLWRGRLLADCAPDALSRQVSVALDELHLTALELAHDADLECGRHQELVAELTALTEQYPLREAFWAQLALALYRADRQTDALDVLTRARRRLVDELGVEPGPRLRELRQRILDADATLVAAVQTAPRALRQLPMDIAEFTGRTAELTRLLAIARSPDDTAVRLCTIVGMGGVGKTRLAIRAAQVLSQEGKFRDVQLWADLRGVHPEQADPAVVLDRFLRALGVQAHDVPDELAERADLYRDRLAGRRVLLLLDDAASEEQVRPLLPGTPGSLVLVTSRRVLIGLDSAQPVPLDVFTTDEALALMTHEAGAERIAREAVAAARVVELCGHLPLAVAMAARHLRNRPSWQLADLVERLSDDQRRLTQLSRHDHAVRQTFDLSYRSLPATHQRLFRLLALHPGDDFAAAPTAALAGLTPDAAESALERLLDEHLLQQPARDRYRMHDLIRLYCAEQTNQTDADDTRDAAFVRLVEHYVGRAEQATLVMHPTESRRLAPERFPVTQPSFADPTAAARWVESEFANLVGTVARAADAGCAPLALRLVRALHRPLANRGHSSDRIALNRLAARTARRLGDRWSEAMALEDLGTLCAQVGRTEAAIEHGSAALALWTDLRDDVGQQGCLADLGNAYRQNGRLSEAVDHLERSIAVASRAGNAAGEASALNYLGLTHQRAARFAQAVTCLRRSSELYRELGNHLGEAIALANLGWTEQRAGEPTGALGYHRKALAIFRLLCDRYNEAEQLWGIGLAHHALGYHHEARDNWHEAITILRDIGLLADAEARALSRQSVPTIPKIIELNT